MDNILSIHDLNTVFHMPGGGVRAIRNLNLEVRRGEVLAIVGESGSGKSTLGFSIMRLIEKPGEISSGEIIFHNSEGDTDILELSFPSLRKFRWKKIAMIFQSAMNTLNPVMRIEKQFIDLFEAHQIQGDHSERIDRYLGIAGLGPKVRRRYPHELSGGMKQRVNIAMALSCEPDLLIADEPTTALDVVVQREILTTILKIKDEFNLTVMFITHDLAVASSVADRLAIFYAGRPIEIGNNDEITRSPKHPYTSMLLSSVIPLDIDPEKKLVAMGGTPPDLRREIRGCSFAERCPIAEARCLEYDLSPVNITKDGYVECIKPGELSPLTQLKN